ncbi:MAG TPA: PKD domain-containing protein, partial [Chitinophagaceae bacterium]|nr:PKD domain-containing protein [Chitinophagaceae bacterium]
MLNRLTLPATFLLLGYSLATAQAPVAAFNASQTLICQGSTVNFFDLSTNTPTSWAWTFTGGTPFNSTAQNPNITYATPGVYDVTLTATNVSGSGTLTMTAYITVMTPPGPSNAGPDQQICDDSTSFAANVPSPGTGQWYVIFGGGVVTTSNSPTSPVTGMSPGINLFEWRVSNDPCTANRDTVRIIVDEPPTPANAGPDQNICSPTNFTTLAGNTPLIGTGLWTLFSGNGVIGTPTSPSAPVTSLGLGTNVFVWTTSNGVCPNSSDTVSITVIAQPTIGVNPPSVALCEGNSFVISGTGGVTYTWAPATGLSATTGTSVSANPTASTTYTVTGTDANGCTNTGTCVITINPFPTVTISQANDTTCSNSPMNITASGATTYAWSPATGLSATVGSSVNCLPVSPTTYTVIGNTNGCQDTATFSMATIPAPTAVVIPATALICQGNSVNLSGSGGTS